MKLIIITLILLSTSLFADKNGNLFIELNGQKSNKEVLDNLLKESIKKDSDKSINTKDFEFFIKKVQKGLTNVIYNHYAYKYKGILVNHKDIVISSRENKAFLLTGKFSIPKIENINSSKSGSQIFKIFNKNLNSLKFHSDIEKSLIIKDNKTYLVYKALIEFDDKNTYKLGWIYLDAKTAKEILFDSNIKDSLRREVYDFKNQCLVNNSSYWNLPKVCTRNGSCIADLLFTEGNSNDTDSDALNAYNNSGITYWFYKHMFNRDSFDNRGVSIISTVHIRFGSERGCYGQNASFLGEPFYQMLYGDGFSRALDVVGHELTHAFTDATSDLIYENESGALNEAMSDIFGATIEAWSDNGGTTIANPETLTPNENTWKIGEDLGGAMRHMNNPKLSGDPDHYSLKIGGPMDNGGVHTNSGIINLSYFLLAMGGNHPREAFQGIAPDVQALGIDKAIRIFYEAQIGLFTSSTNFTNARLLLSVAAENLYGVCSHESEQVNKVFDILGVPGTRRAQCLKTCEDLDCSEISNSQCVEPFNQAYCKCDEAYHWNNNTNLCEEDYICYFISCEVKNSHCEEFAGEGVCICDEGYELSGQTCIEKTTDPCDELICNNGICENNNGTANCKCNPGFELSNDLTCVKYVNPCNDVSCSGHGNCIVKNNQALCGCSNGYHAENLECIKDELDLCENVSCGGHGTCTLVDDKASCVCESGFNAENLNCVKEELVEINNGGSDSSSCNYGNNGNNSYLLFIIMGLFLVILRKKRFYKN